MTFVFFEKSTKNAKFFASKVKASLLLAALSFPASIAEMLDHPSTPPRYLAWLEFYRIFDDFGKTFLGSVTKNPRVLMDLLFTGFPL